ncbi:efflux RND transporter periplasmic adaptor subunit [Mucilaginibacter ginsenosidivorans]|uniref:Efflux RND transporter periplasmic adaptor subunit n=1 Tax=Mucilaginibacter ginsenosidivorans TaxID=398053 RepID=A0A5B8UZS8_9SPHI|nr:efflux RND transporter periplasmic adaptor subunit [Mucilaginibacter ginsenosidivorans]QEC64727.1 efflux RND transporter periplasmic adaptor subunit [Mucilaginibacter ginsenosidivorans]
METTTIIRSIRHNLPLLIAVAAIVLHTSCSSSTAGNTAPPPQELPVVSITSKPVTVYSEFTASLQGKRDIEIRPQVDGNLEAIYVDEGAYVYKGQPLFKIDARPYTEQLNNANATLLSAKASLANALINVNKLAPLVQNNVISDVQLQSAKAAYDAAKANVEQAKAQVESAKINVGYTTITAPADGYIGTIPFKTGSLVVKSQADALTVLSENKEMHAYFTLSESDFINFKSRFEGATLQEKIKHLPEVELVLADNSTYPEKGKVELAEGQFSKTDGTISFRANFSNPNGLLRSGNTGKIRLPNTVTNSLLVPQEATFELQDKVFVYALTDSNKVVGKPVTVTGTSGNFYLVSGGIKAGDKIVYQGIDRLHDGVIIKPKTMPADSLFKTAAL